jgi:hypothetical protein
MAAVPPAKRLPLPYNQTQVLRGHQGPVQAVKFNSTLSSCWHTSNAIKKRKKKLLFNFKA